MSSRKQIESVKYIIDDLSSTNFAIQSKVVILMAHYSRSDLEKEPPARSIRVNDGSNEKFFIEYGNPCSINFGDRVWSMHAIDHLLKCEPRRYFETLRMTALEYLQKKASSDPIFRQSLVMYLEQHLNTIPQLLEDQYSGIYSQILQLMETNSALLEVVIINLINIIMYSCNNP